MSEESDLDQLVGKVKRLREETDDARARHWRSLELAAPAEGQGTENDPEEIERRGRYALSKEEALRMAVEDYWREMDRRAERRAARMQWFMITITILYTIAAVAQVVAIVKK